MRPRRLTRELVPRANPRGLALRGLATHEKPRRATRLGSLSVGMHGLLTTLGQGLGDVHRAPPTCRSPEEYSLFPLDGPDPGRRPADTGRGGPSCFLDWRHTIDRNSRGGVLRDGRHLLNIDHHHDKHPLRHARLRPSRAPRAPRRFIWDLMGRSRGGARSPSVAQALYNRP